jgi:hypothetical protein
MALKLGPEDDDDSVFLMKSIIGFTLPFCFISLFLYIFVYP